MTITNPFKTRLPITKANLAAKPTKSFRKTYKDGMTARYSKGYVHRITFHYKSGGLSHVAYDGTDARAAGRTWSDILRERA